jgi:hypothetical protein
MSRPVPSPSRRLTKKARTERVVLDLSHEHEAANSLPMLIRILFYELEHAGNARKPDSTDMRKNRRRSRGWPPGEQDVIDAVTRLREDGRLRWSWIADTERTLSQWTYAATVGDYIHDRLPEARITPWRDQPPPLILTESKAMGIALEGVASRYVCPITGTKGQCKGFLRTEIAPLLTENGRRVLYIGDYDRAGLDIEANTRRTLEDAAARVLDWTRVAITEAQTNEVEPICREDGRDGKIAPAWEAESLGQAGLEAILRDALDERLPEPLVRVQEREDAEREVVRAGLLKSLGGAE